MNKFFVPPTLEIFHTRDQRRIWDKFWRNVNKDNYNALTENESQIIRELHLERLRGHFKQFATDGTFALPIRLTDGTELLSGYNRIVTGDHGSYIEFDENDLLLPIRTKKGQEWRESEEYDCKYYWKQPVTKDKDGNDVGRNVKIYYQIKKVKYANYLTKMMYIDPHEVMDSCGIIKDDIL